MSMLNIAIPNIGCDNFIADVVVGNDARQTVILEANPFGVSDPCLFESYNNFDGKLLWLKDGVINRI